MVALAEPGAAAYLLGLGRSIHPMASKKIPPELSALFAPLADAFAATLKKSFDAAADAALEDVEERINDIGDRVRRTRRKVARTPKTIDVEAVPSRRGSR